MLHILPDGKKLPIIVVSKSLSSYSYMCRYTYMRFNFSYLDVDKALNLDLIKLKPELVKFWL